MKNRTVPTLRILPYSKPESQGLAFGISKRHGHVVVSDDWDMNDGDDEIMEMFAKELQ